MKLATLVASSILGLSSVAVAKPAIGFRADAAVNLSFGHRAPALPSVIVRDHRDHGGRFERPIAEPPRAYLPGPVARPFELVDLGTVTTGKRSLAAPRDQRFDSLVLDIDGTVHLAQVAVFFADGQQQTVRFDRTVTGRMASPVIDLAGTDRALTRVIVYTTDDQRGQITVLGRNDGRGPGPAPHTRWAQLGSLATGKQQLKLDGHGGFDRLTFTVTGAVRLDRVLIRFADGTEQVARFGVDLTQRMRAPIIELAGDNRRIRSVIVYTADDQRGELTLYGI